MVDTRTRTQRRSDRIRGEIVEAAAQLVTQGGAAALTIDAVAERADVAVQTIYNRVGGRSKLLAAVIDLAIEADRRHMDAAYGSAGTPVERIERAARAYFRFAVDNPAEFALLASPPDDAKLRHRIADFVGEQNAKLAAALADGIADESIRSALPPAHAATALWSMMNGLLLHTLSFPDDAEPETTLLEVAISMMRSGIERT